MGLFLCISLVPVQVGNFKFIKNVPILRFFWKRSQLHLASSPYIKLFNQVWSLHFDPIWSKQKITIFHLSFSDGLVRKRSQMHLASSRSSGELRVIKKSSSCSTIYIDDSTVSQPNLKNTIKVVSLAIYYNIKNRTSNQVLDIFDEKTHPLTVR